MVWTTQDLDEWTRSVVLSSINKHDVHHVPEYQQSKRGDVDMFGGSSRSLSAGDILAQLRSLDRIISLYQTSSQKSLAHGSSLPLVGVKRRREVSELDMVRESSSYMK
jgi:hypothetical protein